MDQSTTTGSMASVSPPKSIVRDVLVMLAAGVIAIAFLSLLAVAGVPMQELDKWMFALSVPWFALLYLVSRKPSFLKDRLIKPVVAKDGLAAVIVAAATAIAYWIHHIASTLCSLLMC
jgi:hypothetical protein